MGRSPRRFLSLGLVGSFVLGWAAAAGAAGAAGAPGFTWRVLKREGRDYLTLENVARFYRLQGDVRASDHRVALQSGGRVRLEVTADPRELVVNGVKQWLSYPLLYEDGEPLVSRFDLAKTIDPALRPTAVAEVRPFRTVVLDAGHGGYDHGAGGVTGWEKDYTLATVLDLRKMLLAKGYPVLLTRADDQFVELEDRAARANQVPNSIFVSIHFNFAPLGGGTGFEVYAVTPRGALSTDDPAPTWEVMKENPGNAVENASLTLATCVQHALLGHLSLADRGVKRARFVVLKETRAPAILVEGGFLSNAAESRRIDQGPWRQKLADAIVAGIQSYRELADKRLPPKLLADYRMEQLPRGAKMVDPTAATPAGPLPIPASNPLPPAPEPTPAAAAGEPVPTPASDPTPAAH